MALSDLWTSPDSQIGLTPSQAQEQQQNSSWWNPGQGSFQSLPGMFYSDVHQTGFNGLPNALPNQTRTGTMDQAQQFDAGGVSRAANFYDPNDIAHLWGGNSYRDSNPFQGAGLDPTLQAQILAGDRGGILHGVEAFLGGFNPWSLENHGIDGGMQQSKDAGSQIQNLGNLAVGFGIDPRSYANPYDLYNDLSKITNDYYTVGGLTNATAGKAGGNLAQRTLYKFNPDSGTLDAASRPVSYVDKADHGFIGREGITGLSMMLPAFGGWAGMLGSGASGTLSAGSGLGLTSGLSGAIGTGATNALVNAGMGAMMNGSGGQGFLTSLLSQGMGAGMNSLTGGANNLSSLFNTANAGQQLNINPLSTYMQQLGRTGLGASPLGQGLGLAGNMNTLANLWRR